MKVLGKSTYDLIIEIKKAGGGPLGEREDVRETTLKQWLELQQEQVNELVERSTSRQREINLVETLRDDNSEPEVLGRRTFTSNYAKQLADKESQGEFANHLSQALIGLQTERTPSSRTGLAVSVVQRTPRPPTNSLAQTSSLSLNAQGGRHTGFTPPARRSRSEGEQEELRQTLGHQSDLRQNTEGLRTSSSYLVKENNQGFNRERSTIFQHGERISPGIQHNTSQADLRSLMPPPGTPAGRSRSGDEGRENPVLPAISPAELIQDVTRLTRRKTTFIKNLECTSKRVEVMESRDASKSQVEGMEKDLGELHTVERNYVRF